MQNLESELFVIDVLGITSSWPQFHRLNAQLSKLTWLVRMSKIKLFTSSQSSVARTVGINPNITIG